MLYPEYGAYGFFGTGLILHYTYEHVRHWRYTRRLRKRAAQQQETYKKNGSFVVEGGKSAGEVMSLTDGL